MRAGETFKPEKDVNEGPKDGKGLEHREGEKDGEKLRENEESRALQEQQGGRIEDILSDVLLRTAQRKSKK